MADKGYTYELKDIAGSGHIWAFLDGAPDQKKNCADMKSWLQSTGITKVTIVATETTLTLSYEIPAKRLAMQEAIETVIDNSLSSLWGLARVINK